MQCAKELQIIIFTNPPKLLEDEINLCKSLGIEITHRPVVINLFDSGRVSVTWHATTASITDSIKWALQALPNDRRKRIEVEKFLTHTVTSWLKDPSGMDVSQILCQQVIP